MALARRLALLLTAALAATVIWSATPASARQSDWFVTAAVAERVTNRAYKMIYPNDPTSTKCYGVGGSLEPKRPGGGRFYQRFNCTVRVFLSGSTPTYRVTFRVRNKYWATLQEGWGLYGRELGRYRWR